MGREMGREMGQMGHSPPLLPPLVPPDFSLFQAGPPTRCRPAALGSEPPPSGDREPQGATHRACKPGSRQRTSSSVGAMVPRARGARSEASGRAPLPPGRRPRLRRLRGRGLRLDSGRTGAGSGGRPRPRRLAGLRAAPRDPAPLRRAGPSPSARAPRRSGGGVRCARAVPGSWAPQPAAPAAQPTLLPAARRLPPAARRPPVPRARWGLRAAWLLRARRRSRPRGGVSPITRLATRWAERRGAAAEGGTPALRLGRGWAPLGGEALGDPTGSLRMGPRDGPRRPEGTPGSAVVSTRQRLSGVPRPPAALLGAPRSGWAGAHVAPGCPASSYARDPGSAWERGCWGACG